MRKASYITPGISIFLFMLFLLIRLSGLMPGETLGGFLHLLLLALVLPIIGFLVGSVLLLISLTKKQNQRSVNKIRSLPPQIFQRFYPACLKSRINGCRER